MKKPMTVALLFSAYCGLVFLLFLGVKRADARLKQAWYDQVTRRAAAKAAAVEPDQCLLGVYRPELPYGFDGMRGMEEALGTRFTLVSFYQAWADGDDGRFPAALMDAVDAEGCVPVLTWEPWVSGFDRPGLKPLSTRDVRCMSDVAAGAYDFYVTEWAKETVRWGKPFFLRFAHEIGNTRYPWSPANENRPEDFIRAWWRVRGIFDSLGATNVVWVWCPYTEQDLYCYHGDEYVDWVAIDVFNYGDLLADEGDIRWRSFDQLLSGLYRRVEPLRKPVMLAEVGCSDMGGSREVWYEEMFTHLKEKYTIVKALIFFENPADRTFGSRVIDWSVVTDPDACAAVRQGLAQGRFAWLGEYSKALAGRKTQ